VSRLIDAIHSVNSNPDMLLWVAEADLFGSYIAGANDLGDVDVAIRLERRRPGDGYVEASLARAEACGFRGTFVQRAYWGELEVKRSLKAASSRLDIQEKSQIEALGYPMTPLFRREAPVPKR
jgi:hypothetical protein